MPPDFFSRGEYRTPRRPIVATRARPLLLVWQCAGRNRRPRPKESTMDVLVNIVAEALLLGSLALLIWGAILTVGQLLRSGRAGSAADAAGSRGEDRRRTQRAGFASVRRRFRRLAPPA